MERVCDFCNHGIDVMYYITMEDVVKNTCKQCADKNYQSLVTKVGSKYLPHVEVKLLPEIITFIASLSEEDKKKLNVDDFSAAIYQHQANILKHDDSFNFLKELKSDIEIIRRKEKLPSIPSLLVRYSKLSSPWKSYLISKMEFDLEGDRDEALFSQFGELSKEEDLDAVCMVLENFDSVLKEIESHLI